MAVNSEQVYAIIEKCVFPGNAEQQQEAMRAYQVLHDRKEGSLIYSYFKFININIIEGMRGL